MQSNYKDIENEIIICKIGILDSNRRIAAQLKEMHTTEDRKTTLNLFSSSNLTTCQ